MDPCPFGWFNGDYTILKKSEKELSKNLENVSACSQ
jgi:hypothetical protein